MLPQRENSCLLCIFGDQSREYTSVICYAPLLSKLFLAPCIYPDTKVHQRPFLQAVVIEQR